MNKNQIIILKNDAVGDLTHSLSAIGSIINSHPNHFITIYLSERSKKFSFLIRGKNIKFKFINYRITFIQKINLFIYLVKESIDKVYILSPKKFYYYLPVIFRKKKFYAICIDGHDGYQRPANYLRKFLFKYIINDRSIKYKRPSTSKIQSILVGYKNENQNQPFSFENKNNFLESFLKKKYAYFHIKASIIKKLNWSDSDLSLFFSEILRYHENLFITRDIESNNEKKNYTFKYNLIDLNKSNLVPDNNNNNIYLFDNIEGIDLYNLINNSKKIIAFHGMMTNLGSLNKKKILDLFFCEINRFRDYHNYRNSFYEFKPKYTGYDFTIPSKNIHKTIKKIQYSLKQ